MSPLYCNFAVLTARRRGGAKILKRVAGKDASKQFWKYHNESVLKKYSDRLKIGQLQEQAKL